MKETLKLKNPVYIDGKEVYSLDYDPDEITLELFDETAKKFGAATQPKEFNDQMHLGLFWASVMALDERVSFDEMNNVKGMYDLTNMINIGRDFIIGSDESAEKDSDPASGTIPKTSTPAPKNSEKEA